MQNYRIILQSFQLKAKSVKQLHERIKHNEDEKKKTNAATHDMCTFCKDGKKK